MGPPSRMEGMNAVTAPASPPPAKAAAGRSAAGQDTASRSLLLRLLPLIVAAAYFAVMMPIGANMILHYPDERHYAYGGARMVETGDWLVPQTPQGEVRLKKPVIPYWFSAAGFELLGIGVPGFRLFWVIASCGILLLTYAMARVLGAGRPVALLAELMIAANPVVMRAATNAIPDIPLTLFVSAAALGFVAILAARQARPREGWTWLGWIGLALAVLTKGLLPLILAATLIAYVALFDRTKLGAVLRPLPVAAAVVLVGAWYVFAAASYPADFTAQFFGDQITGNATRSPGWVLAYLPAYVVLGLASFLGWPLVLLWLAARTRPNLSPAGWPSAVRLLALWCAAVVAVFALSDAVDPRYLLPVLPMLAVLIALGIAALDGDGLPETARICRRLIPLAVLGGLALAALAAAIIVQAGRPLAIALIAVGALAWVTIGIVGWRTPRLAPYLLGATPVLAVALIALAMAPVVLPDRGELFAARLAASGIPAPEAAFVGDVHTASETRLHAGQAAPFVEIDKLTDAVSDEYCTIMATRRDVAEKLAGRGFTVDEIRGGWRELDVAALFGAVFTGRLAEAREKNGSVGYFAQCAGRAKSG